MIDEHDARLQRMFDERLMRVLPAPRRRRKPRSARATVGVALAIVLTGAGFGFAADVNRTADAAGESCADVLAKVELWFDAVKNGTTQEQMDFKRRAGELIGGSCPKSGTAVNATKPNAQAKAPGSIEENRDPRCLAAQNEIKAWAQAHPAPSRSELLEFKTKANQILEAACTVTVKGR